MSQLSNSPKRHTHLRLEARKSYAFGMQFTRSNKARVDLTGCDLRIVVKKPKRQGGTVVISTDAQFNAAELGLAQFNLQAADLELTPGEYPFSIVLQSALGYTTVVVKGELEILENTETESSTSTFPGINPSTNLSVIIDDGDLIHVRVDHLDGMYVIVEERIAGFTELINTMLSNYDTYFASQMQAAADSAAEAEAHSKNYIPGPQGQPGPAGIVIVEHGTDANVARPPEAVGTIVHWIGTAYPVFAAPFDFLTRVNMP